MHSQGNASPSANAGALQSRRGKQHLLLIFWSLGLSELVNRNTEEPTSPTKAHAQSFPVSIVVSHYYYRYYYCCCCYFQQGTGAQGIYVLGTHSDIEPTTTLRPSQGSSWGNTQVGERKEGRGKEGIKQAWTGGSFFSYVCNQVKDLGLKIS